MPGVYHLYDIGDRLSWWELKVVIDNVPEESALARKLIAAHREKARELDVVRREEEKAAAIAALPEDERPIGSDGIPLEDMANWLGWEVDA